MDVVGKGMEVSLVFQMKADTQQTHNRYTTDTQEKQMLLQMTHLKKTADSLLFGVLLQGKLPHVCFVLDTIASPSRHV